MYTLAIDGNGYCNHYCVVSNNYILATKKFNIIATNSFPAIKYSYEQIFTAQTLILFEGKPRSSPPKTQTLVSSQAKPQSGPPRAHTSVLPNNKSQSTPPDAQT